MKLLTLGDSFGLPRCFKDNQEIEVKVEDTYPEQLRQLLKKEFKQDDIMTINMCKRFNNSLFLIQREFGEVYLMQPEYLIIQVGIVDCWSREDGSYICEEFKGKDPWISEEEYITYLKQFVENSFRLIKSLKAIVIINITKASKHQYDRHLQSNERTIRYNEKLQTLKNIDKVFIADVYEKFSKELDEALCSDGLHPSSYGNFLMAKKILDIIKSQIYFEKGIISLNQSDNENAIKHFEKVYECSFKEHEIYWKALNNLITLYLNNKKYKELRQILLLENIIEDDCYRNEYYIEMIKFTSQKLIEDKQIEFKEIREKYFNILDCLIKFGEFDLFNSIINKFTKEYDCVSYEKHGELMVKYGLDELATEAFIKAVELRSNNSSVYSYIAKKFVAINEIEDGLGFAFTALNIDKKNIEAYEVIINIYENMGNIDKVNEFRLLKNEIF